MGTHEHTLNVKIAEILNAMRHHIEIKGESTRQIKGKNKRPDILVQRSDSVLVIENEYAPAYSVVEDALSRLDEKIGGYSIHAAIALITPEKFKDMDEISNKKLLSVAYKYAMYSGSKVAPNRFPEKGWIEGNLEDFASFVGRASISPHKIAEAAQSLSQGVKEASAIISQIIEKDSDVYKKLDAVLHQGLEKISNRKPIKPEQQLEQLRRMCMTIIINALVFHYNLEGKHNIASPMEFVSDKEYDISGLYKEWKKILEINYWPIFGIACDIVVTIPTDAKYKFIDVLYRAAEGMVGAGVTRSHDLSGRVFQKLISDRKFLATFYTRPASAVLLANLAIPSSAPQESGNWKDLDKNKYVIGDFACGTGTLLSTAYERVAELHERDGGDMKKMHKTMMEESLVGCDVLPSAVHLTASMLSGAYPSVLYDKTYTVISPYGKGGHDDYLTGSLELLAKVPDITEYAPAKRQFAKESQITSITAIPRKYNLVIMNPPFTRSTNHEGAHANIPNPAWAAFDTSNIDQSKLGKRAKFLRRGTCGHGNAGLASDFMALANKMIKSKGTVAVVLPLSALAGESWQGVRSLWSKNYDNIRVITIANRDIKKCSFSADTAMAETLLIGTKSEKSGSKRGIFISLKEPPEDEIEGNAIAHAISKKILKGIKKLENGPVGGTNISIGDTVIGFALDAPLPNYGEWEISRVRNMSIAQTAYKLCEESLLWFSRQSRNKAINLPMCALSKFADRGFISRDICETNETKKGVPRGAFTIVDIEKNEHPDYPCLWAHDAKRETQITLLPDAKGEIMIGREERALEIWKKRSRVLHNADFSFNAHCASVAYTEEPVIGGRAWPNVILKSSEMDYAYVLWANSTLGLLVYWWKSNKIHPGRGSISAVKILDIPSLDLTKLKAKQLKAAERGFKKVSDKKLLPFYRANECDTRKEIDKILLIDVLGLNNGVLEKLDFLRTQLCEEPSVRGSKKR